MATTGGSKEYLGDGVYVDVCREDGVVTLTAENGIRATDTIYLGPAVLASFVEYLARVAGGNQSGGPDRES